MTYRVQIDVDQEKDAKMLASLLELGLELAKRDGAIQTDGVFVIPIEPEWTDPEPESDV